MQFPEGFVWGVACASYQCEGGWQEDGKGPSIWDDFCHQPGHVRGGNTGDVACDVYHLYEQDAALMRQLGIENYRFSISWPRVMPQGRGRINEKGLGYYDRLVDDLLQKGIRPWVTLYHWDLPSALQQMGGWMNRDMANYFAEYAAVVAQHLGDRVSDYMTLNEPQCSIGLGYGVGIHAPGLKLGGVEEARGYHIQALAHSLAVDAIRANASHPVQIGIASTGRICYPAHDTPLARATSAQASFDLSKDWSFTHNILLDDVMLGELKGPLHEDIQRFRETLPPEDGALMRAPDFIGINCYNGQKVDSHGQRIPYPIGAPMTSCKWPVTPEAIKYAAIHLYDRYRLPIYITENGVGCCDKVYMDGQVHDLDRIDFLTRYLHSLAEAVQEGVPVKGYFHWSFLDNFEWAEGYNERFGMVYVDYQTQQRICKDSAKWYAKLIQRNEC